jgi:hypothetical protein
MTPTEQESRDAAAVLDKRFADLRRRLAAHGFALSVIAESADSAYLISRWAWAKRLPTLEAVEDFAAKVGAV